MVRPLDTTPIQPHSSVNPDYQLMTVYGRHTWCAEVTCPFCSVRRWYPLFALRQQIKRFNFTGQCRLCGQKRSRAGYYQWAKRSGVARRSLNWAGYIELGPTYVKAQHLPIFRTMQNRAGIVFEHRFVMALHLGRALQSWECIDHMDGNKENNAIENLRIYVRGKNQPGSTNGHGTYYHELQMALRRIQELEAI